MSVSIVSQALVTRGFAFRGRSPKGGWTFEGWLTAGNRRHPASVCVDPKGIQPPVVRLLDIPRELQPIAPHLAADGTLCYLAAGSITLDVYDLPGQTLACLARAEEVLGKILSGEMIDDLREEFPAYWGSCLCFLDVPDGASKRLSGLVFGKDPSRVGGLVTVTVDAEQTLLKLNKFPRSPRGIRVFRVWTTASPRPLQGCAWPPATLGAVLRWQHALDKRCERKIEKSVRDSFVAGYERVFCLVTAPRSSYGFSAALPNCRLGGRTARRRFLDRRVMLKSRIQRFTPWRVDDAYVAQRSNPGGATLGGIRIVLVGCGTIGGYLADLLTKSGAGGQGGELSLVDNDVLLPQNIGRHRLGFNNVLRNKAEGLAEELLRGYPTAKIIACPVDAMEMSFRGIDLVVDATGEEGLSHLLARKLSGRHQIPSLTVWIEGPGTAVRGLLRDAGNDACPRCLRGEGGGSIYPVVLGELPHRFAGEGCESLYVPFAATTSVHAACLGAEMALAWANRKSTPKLRTRILEPGFTKGAEDFDPPRASDCSACAT